MNIIVTGGHSGLGAAIISALQNTGHVALSYDIMNNDDVLRPPRNMTRWFGPFETEGGPLIHGLINCAGINGGAYLENLRDVDWDRIMDVNAKGIMKMTQACLPALIETKGFVCNIVSNAAHVPMTASLAYNASKAAAHIMTLQLARELTRRWGITVFGVAPNKLRGTAMSKAIEAQTCDIRGWTPEYAAQYQAQALLTGEETPPESVAELIAFLVSKPERHRYLTGCVLPYGA